MKNIFNTSINTPKAVTYQSPPIITLSGLLGSGKTDLACILSSTLEIYLISNDTFATIWVLTLAFSQSMT